MRRQLYTSLLCFCLLIVMFVGSSLAWFTDDVYYADVMTTGNLAIQQTIESLSADARIVPGATYQKKITVTNLGNIPCYVRTLVAFEDTKDKKVTVENGVQICVTVKVSETETETIYYTVGVYTHGTPLAASQSCDIVGTFAIDANAGNEWCTAVGEYAIHTLSQATQAVGWPDQDGQESITAVTALNKAFGQITSGMVAEWFTEVMKAHYGENVKVDVIKDVQ